MTARSVLAFLIAATSLAAAFLAWLHLTQGPRAERIDIRWAAAVSAADRARAERELGLVDGAWLQGGTWQYLLRKRSPRKEILAFLPLALLAVGHARQQITRARIVIVGVLFVLAAFSHEVAAFMLPFFLGLVYLSWTDSVISTRVAQRLALFFVLVSMAGIATALVFPIDSATMTELCASLRDQGFRDSICDGALAWLDKGIEYGFVERQIAVPTYTLFHVAALAVSLVPLWAVRWWGRARAVLIGGTLLWMLPLYVVSIDWGRWVYVYVFSLFTIVFADTVRRSDAVRRVPFALVVLYVISWSIPLCCGYSFRGGFSQDVYQSLRTGGR